MKHLRVLFCIIISAVILLSTTACKGSSNVYDNKNYFTKGGALTASPRFAYYNDGKEVSELEEIDKEIFDEGVKDDGSFTIYFAVSNNTDFDRKITSLKVKKIQTKDGKDIVEPSEFSMDSDVYIASGETMLIPCIFEKDFVLMNARLKDLVCETTVSYEGCVVSGKEPLENANGFAYSVAELKFTSTNGIEGSFYIKNNDKFDAALGKISFELYTNDGKKITNSPVEMDVNQTIEEGGVVKLKYAVLPDNVSKEIAESKLFDSVEIKVTEE